MSINFLVILVWIATPFGLIMYFKSNRINFIWTIYTYININLVLKLVLTHARLNYYKNEYVI